MKPNGEELASFTGHDADELEADPAAAAAAAAQPRRPRASRRVLATLGPHGAVLVTADGAWHATPPPTDGGQHRRRRRLQPLRLPPRSDREPAARPTLALAVAYGSAAAGLPGTTIPHPSQVNPELVAVRDLDLTQGG